ncbi:MAG: 2TM domain-containing protein [Actinomycetes bacterium]
MSMSTNSTPMTSSEDRVIARKRIEARRDLGTHLVVYLVVNTFVVVMWALTGQGYFWPAWLIAGWGIGLVMNAWDVYGRKPVTEADVDEELRRKR